MQDFATRVIQSHRNGLPHPAPQPLLVAAREVLAWYHDQLTGLRPMAIDRGAAAALTVKRDWALYVLIDYGGGGWAKRQQLEVTDGQPLGICTGGRGLMFVQTLIGEMRTSTIGCLRVFEEALNVEGRKWPALCPHCQPRSGHRNPYRDARRALRAEVKKHLANRDT